MTILVVSTENFVASPHTIRYFFKNKKIGCYLSRLIKFSFVVP